MPHAPKYCPLIDTVIASSSKWSESTKRTAKVDANVTLESLLAEYGIDKALEAIGKQGLGRPDVYRYVVAPMYDLAIKRRDERNKKPISD